MNQQDLIKWIAAMQDVHQFYKSTVWKHKRKQMLERDNFECQMCKKAGKYSEAVVVHHIKHLKDLGITEIEICGTDTDACCLAIAFNLFDNCIKPIILSNLCASSSRNKNNHLNALDIMKRQFGNDNVI